MDGQVCYQADVNQYKKDMENIEDVLQFNFIVDTNEEYDAFNLLKRTEDQGKINTRYTSVFKKTATEKRFSVFLKTISNLDIIMQYVKFS